MNQRTVLVTASAALVLLIVSLTISLRLSSERGNAFDVYPHLIALDEFYAGHTPYSIEVAEEIQQGYYGRLAHVGEDQFRIPYPAYAYLLLAPLQVARDSLVIPIWMALQLPAIFLALCLAAALEECVSPRMVGIILAMTLSYRYSITIALNAQFNSLLLLGYIAGLTLIARQRDGWGGTLIAMTTLQPTLMGPLAFIQLGGLALRGRWRALAALVFVLAVLTSITFLMIGWWIPDWLSVLGGYSSYQSHLTWVPQRFGILFSAFGAGLLIVTLIRSFSLSSAYALSVVGLLLLIPQTGVYYLITLLPIILIAVQRASKQLGWRRTTVYILAIGFLGMSWLYPALEFEQSKIEALAMPLLALITLAAASWPTSLPASSCPSGAVCGGKPPGPP